MFLLRAHHSLLYHGSITKVPIYSITINTAQVIVIVCSIIVDIADEADYDLHNVSGDETACDLHRLVVMEHIGTRIVLMEMKQTVTCIVSIVTKWTMTHIVLVVMNGDETNCGGDSTDCDLHNDETNRVTK